MENSLTLGIDFGTSNSAVAHTEDNQTKIYSIGEGDTKTQPSAIFINENGYHSTGDQAIRDANTQNGVSHLIPHIKQGLGIEEYRGTKLNKRFFGIETLSSFILKDLKMKAERESLKSSDSVVIGRPVEFSSDKKLDNLAESRLKKAAEISGFQNIQFLYEPIAAALYFERHKLTEKKKVFVFDFGGGTLDACILQLDPNDTYDPERLKQKVLASYGVELGGTDLDKDVFNALFQGYFGKDVTYLQKKLPIPVHIHESLTDWQSLQRLKESTTQSTLSRILRDPYVSDQMAVARLLTFINQNQLHPILASIERAKINLSLNAQAQIEYLFSNLNINEVLARSKFEQIISERRRQISSCISETLNLACSKPEDVDLVLKVGGSSNNPFVDNILNKHFTTGIENTDPLTTVVAGLSIAANDIYK